MDTLSPGGSSPERGDETRRSDAVQPVELSASHELVRQFVLVFGAVLLYFAVRGLTQGNVEVAIRHGHDVLAFEARLGIDLEQRAQDLIIEHRWLVDAVNWIYIWGHWPVIVVTLLWLHHGHRIEYLVLRNAMFVSGAIGLVIFATYAVAPPRLLDVGLADTVTQHSNAYRILQPPSLVNKYAAIPSLHVGWNLLVGISLYRSAARPPLKVFAVVHPLLMAVAVVLTANHYVIDGFLGAALALFGLAVSRSLTPAIIRFDRRLLHRRRREVTG